jgi:hypothetical protein
LAIGDGWAILAVMTYRSVSPLLVSFALLACTGPVAPNLCETVRCGVSGTTCDPIDGVCRCGASGGDVCMEGEECVVATSTCQPPIIAGPGTR